MMNTPQDLMQEKAKIVDAFISDYIEQVEDHDNAEIKNLVQSMKYSLLNGGKRFRPVLSLLIADLFKAAAEKVLPFAMATEMIHTYSLIHDDLPCMDDDDERRGQPTNHKVHGEDIALIAGDGLLTEAFYTIAKFYSSSPEISQRLTFELSKAAGHRGMVGGQAIDLKAQKDGIKKEDLILLHQLKTGALIEVTAVGAAIACDATETQVNKIRSFASCLGLAFQVADDILDYSPEDLEKGNFATVIGLEKTQSYLNELSQQAISSLDQWENTSSSLKDIVVFNQQRSI